MGYFLGLRRPSVVGRQEVDVELSVVHLQPEVPFSIFGLVRSGRSVDPQEEPQQLLGWRLHRVLQVMRR